MSIEREGERMSGGPDEPALGAPADGGADPIGPDYPVTPVRCRRGSRFSRSQSCCSGSRSFMLAGAALGPAFMFWQLQLVILGGLVILKACVTAMGYVGARTGLTTVVMPNSWVNLETGIPTALGQRVLEITDAAGLVGCGALILAVETAQRQSRHQ